MNRVIIAGVIGWLAATVATAADEPAAPWNKPIDAPDRSQDELLAVPLDSGVYARAQANLADLRIVDGDGQTVPYLVRHATETRRRTERATWDAQDVALKPSADAGLEIRITLDKQDPQPGGLSVLSPLRNFEQRVQVFGVAEDGAETLLADELIFDYTQYMDVRRQEIPLADNTARSFRIVVGELTADQESQVLALTRTLSGGRELLRQERTSVDRRPFRIDRIVWWRETTRDRVKGNRTVPYPVTVEEVRIDEETGRTLIEVSSQREPLVLFRLRTPSRNFSRSMSVELPLEREGTSTWRTIGQGTVSRFEFREIREEHVEVRFPETRAETFRLVIENRDSPPLEIDGIEAEGAVHELLFLAEPERSYALQYGLPEEEPPQYDTAAIQHLLRENVTPVAAELGAETQVAEVPVERPGLRGWINNPYVLGTVVVLLAAVLGWMLYAAGRRIDGQTPG